jgi:hypothetical protein
MLSREVATMTEAEWQACVDAEQMVAALPAATPPRRLHLLCAACCARVAPLLVDARSRGALETLVRYADGAATDDDLRGASESALGAFDDLCDAAGDRYHQDPAATAAWAVWTAATSEWDSLAGGDTLAGIAQGVLAQSAAAATDSADEGAAQAGLIRDICGSPFHPVTVDPEWFTPTVVSLARQMYDTRDFSQMPILADALQDAGCDNADVLDHCRGDGPHVRGCWVVDRVLGKM